MDVPSWHPANQDADALRQRQALGAAAPKRTEFKLMAGSSADTSTEAGRQLAGTGVTDGGAGRGFFDASDRLYLSEQRRLEQQAKDREQAERDAALSSFRSNALKLQKLRPATEIPLASAGKRRRGSSDAKPQVAIIKAKKRAPAESHGKKPVKKAAKKHKQAAQTPPGSPARRTSSANGGTPAAPTSSATGTSQPPSTEATRVKKSPTSSNTSAAASAAALLLEGYSSSSDED